MHLNGAAGRKAVMPALTSIQTASSCCTQVHGILAGMSATVQDARPYTDDARLGKLVTRMATGDEAALAELHRLTLSRVYGMALRITRRADLAEEVCIETYWQAWREAIRYDNLRGQPMAWLIMMARSRALDQLRRLDPAEPHEDPAELIARVADDSSDLANQLVDRENSAQLHQAISQLSPIQRQMLALAYFRDLSHQEISQHTGLPLGTVKSHLKRAQDALRDMLGKGAAS